jgi:hypothetical protein
MIINTDTFLKIGDQHKICEDYVISGEIKRGVPPLQYIILSDGCSKSNRTEMGARILCYVAQQFIRFNFIQYPFEPDYKNMGLWIIHNAEMMARNLGLNRDCLDATLIISWIDWLNYPVPFSNIYMYGDGFVLHKKENGSIQVNKVDYQPENAPYYLSYELDPSRKAAYHALKIKKVNTFINNEGNESSEQWAYDSPTTFMANMSFDSTIMIASDGFGSFYSQDGSNEPSTIITPDVMAPGFINFKGTKGSFLQRRASKEVKALNKNGIFHFDDLSIGAYVYEVPKDDNLSTEEPSRRSEISS